VTTVNARAGAVVIGLMSGTSLDGISAVAVRFADRPDGGIESTMLAYTHRGFPPADRARLEAAMREGSARDYCRLHADLGDWLAEAALSAIVDSGVPRGEIAAIASHGQTLWHEPGHSTWQIGDAARIAERTGCAVIADFRARDVAARGQGAPLVPMADARLFAHATEWRALQNLGGIGNVTVVPPASTVQGTAPRHTDRDAPNAHDATAPTDREYDLRAVRAFDTGPGVVIIDAVTRALRPSLPYDRDGLLALAGRPLTHVVDECLRHPWFASEPPKSTGREWFSREYITHFIERCRTAPVGDRLDAGGKHVGADARGNGRAEVRDEDIIATATSFTARAIADQYQRFVPEPIGDVVLSGGGAKNPALVAAIEHALGAPSAPSRGPLRVTRFDDVFFDGEAKEAVAFALLGYLHLTGRSGNVPSATGARGARTLGHYTPAA